MANTKPLASQVKYGSGNNTVDKTLKKSILSFSTLVEAQAAAATLPDGQRVEIEADETRDSLRTWYEVQGGELVFYGYADQTRFDLADVVNPENGAALVARAIARVDAITETSALGLRDGDVIFAKGRSAAGDGGGGLFTYYASSVISVDGGIVFAPATGSGRFIRNCCTLFGFNGPVSVTWFGVKGDGSTDNTASILAARNWIATTLAAGNRHKLVFPPGRYMYSESPNWAIDRLDLEFQGEVWLINTGSGVSFLVDGGETGAGVLGLKIKGYPLVYGGASTTNGYFLRSVHRSDLELNCRGAGNAYAGLYMAWCVSNTVKFIMNFNEGGLYNVPARGIFLTSRNANEETSYNTFINPECSGMPVGIYEDASLGNLFIGGAVQACSNVGLQQTANCWNSKFIGTDFEVNTNGDVECNARESQFIGVDMEKKITLQSAAVNCSVIGGAIQDIIVNSGATRTLLSGVTYNRFGGGNITDNGTQTRYRDVRDKFSGIVSNTPRAKTTVSVGASPFTYTNTTGNEIDLIITGGTVSQLIYTRFAGDVISPPQGMFRLSPGDSMTMTYSVAPTVLEYTR